MPAAQDLSYFLCENAYFDMAKISAASGAGRAAASAALNGDSPSSSKVSVGAAAGGNIALFCDISEKDFELTKTGYKLFLGT